tara:strand:- start:397 stop:1494 length:1098 start_codon:yes stop_codon:yes gene_type:complete
MKILPIKTKSKQYNIYIGYNVISQLNKIINKENIKFKKALIVVDRKIPKYFIKRIKSKISSEKKLIYFFNSSERNKNILNVNLILEVLLKNNFTRNDVIICLGGGIVGDISGFTASIYKRGLKFINIPSTLLSQVDSSIGGKTGVNSSLGKNLIGSFYQPDIVISDTMLLNSLPKREIICGYAEILKHSLIKSRKFFLFLDKNLKKILKLERKIIERAILESCRIKKQIVEKDEREKNIRKSLNLGHTFGHAYEATLNYSRKLNHGEAVLYGIYSAINLSKKLKKISSKDYQLIASHLAKLHFNDLKKFFNNKDLNKILSFMVTDKKNTSKKINFITLKKIGLVDINNQLSTVYVKKFIKLSLLN